MIHELGEQRKVLRQAEAIRIVFAVFAEFLAETDELPIDPTESVWAIVGFRSVDDHSRHEDRRSFLIESGTDHVQIGGGIGPTSRHSGDSNSPLSTGMLILCDELKATSPALGNRRRMLVGHFEEECHRAVGRHRAELPLRRVSHSNLRIGHGSVFDVERNARSDSSLDFQLAGTLNLQGAIEGHLQISLLIHGEYSLVGLFEEGRVERISHNHVTSGRVATLLHLHQTRLIQGTGVNVDAVPICSSSQRQGFVMLDSLLHELGIVLLDVVMRTDWMLQFIIHNLTGSLRAWATEEHHNASSSVGVSAFQKAHSNR